MQDGLFAQIAVLFGGKAQNYLANPAYFRTIYVLSDIWSGIGWNSIIYLAALSSIDQEQYEAARVDGANRFQQMLHITLPAISSIVVVMLILRIGKVMNAGFEQILVLQNPITMEKIDIFDTFVYREGLGRGSYSFAAAVDTDSASYLDRSDKRPSSDGVFLPRREYALDRRPLQLRGHVLDRVCVVCDKHTPCAWHDPV